MMCRMFIFLCCLRNKLIVMVVCIFGIDFGLCVIGFGVIEVCGSKFSYVVSGVIKMLGEENLFECIKVIFDGIVEVV